MRRDHATRRPAARRAAGRKLWPTVEGIEKRVLLANFIVTSTADDPDATDPNSLRSILIRSNATPGANNITFNLPVGVQTIALTRSLPAVTVPTTITATTAPNGAPLVFLNGSGITTGGGDGLSLTAGRSAVNGLGIYGFSGDGISMTGAGGNTVANCYIGINPAGTAAAPNGVDGIGVGAGSDGNTISNNVLSGNFGYGLRVDGQFGGTTTTTTSGNSIVGNTIGLNAAGTVAVANGFGGILVRNAPNTTIGGTGGVTGRNVVSGNTFTVINGVQFGTGNGIDVLGGSAGTLILGNYVGTNAAGSAAVRNNGVGIALQGVGNLTIGGSAVNVISGNAGAGIGGSAAANGTLTIAGNYIGTDVNGTLALGNGGDGIAITGNSITTIGGTAGAATRNVVSGNGGNGMTLAGAGIQVRGNYVGAGSGGITALGNAGAGIVANASGIRVGGADSSFSNLIANNAAGGVVANATGVTISTNSIFNNATRGIINGANSPPAPVLTTAVSAGNTSRVNGSLTAPDGTYNLQFFTTPTLNAGGNAEGRTYLGAVNVTVAGGSATFSASVNGFQPLSYISATATLALGGSLGGTSNFSAGVVGTGLGPDNSPPTLRVSSAPATVNAGDNVTYTFTIANNSAVADTGVVFSNPIPAGTSFFSGTTSTGVPVVLTNGTANAQLGTIASRGSVTVTIVLTAGAGAVPSFTNTAGVTAVSPTIGPGEDTITSGPTTVIAAADLAVSVVGPATSTPVGQNLTYTVTISNYGPSEATNVRLVDTLPANTTFVSASTSSTNPADAPANSGNQVTATVASIPAGGVVTYVITVATNGTTPASVINTATVAADQVDPDPSTNGASASSVVIPSADLAIVSEVASAAAVQAGATVTFTIQLVNNGPSPSTGVLLTDTLPAGLAFVSGTAAGGAVTAANGVVRAPVGGLAIGATSTVTITVRAVGAGLISDSAVVSSDDGDPDPGNNTSSASVTVSPLTDLTVGLVGTPATLNTGNPLTFIGTVTNAGPSPATNVVFSLPLPAGATFQSATVDGVAGGSVTNNILTAALGTVAAGQTVTVVVTVIPTVAGTITSTATVSTDEPDSNPADNSSVATTVLTVPRPVIAFSSSLYTYNEADGTATITLTRSGDTSGTLTVHFSTVAGGNATPGLDYTPVSTTVTFAPGVSTATVAVPLLANPFDRFDEYVALQLDSPTDAVLVDNAATSSAALRIVNLDPVLVGPTVTEVKLYGPRNAITGIEVSTTGNLDPATASNPANYTILAQGGGGRNGLPAGRTIPVALAVYNPATGIVLLIPAAALPANQLFLLNINGTRAGAVADRAGNPLNSTVGVSAGADYNLTVARGTNLNFTDENGARVNLRLSGPGTLDIDRAATGQLGRLQILGGVARRTSVTGSVSGGRRTNIGSILGLDRFGTYITRLYSPPFFLANAAFPNPRNLVNTPAVDVLLPSAAGTPTVSGRATRAAVHARAVTVPATPTPHAGLARAAHKRPGR